MGDLATSKYDATGTIAEKILAIHDQLRQRWPQLSRMSVALYDPQRDQLDSYAWSASSATSLHHCPSKLSQSRSLSALAEQAEARIIQRRTSFETRDDVHAGWLEAPGYTVSYILPLYFQEQLSGFVFFQSEDIEHFTPDVTQALTVYSEFIHALLLLESNRVGCWKFGLEAVQASRRMDSAAQHMKRKSRYVQALGQQLLNEDPEVQIDLDILTACAPFLDLGKIATEDQILSKSGHMSAQDFVTFQQHVADGLAVVECVIDAFPHLEGTVLDTLRQLIAQHHEKFNGSGYPAHLHDQQISMESRICAVVDVLDVMTSNPAQRGNWDFDVAIDYILQHANDHFDPLCVNALGGHREQFRTIYQAYRH